MTGLAPAIVLGVDTPIGLSIVRQLGQHGVPVHLVGKSARSISARSRWVRSFTVRPPGPLADWLPAFALNLAAGAIFAISETTLIELADLAPILGGAHVLTPRQPALGIVLDKIETLARARAFGIETPESWQPDVTEDFAGKAATLRYPVVAKWRDPNVSKPLLNDAGLEFHKAEYAADAVALLALLDRYRTIGLWPMIQSYCPGHGLGQMLYMENGRATLRFQHRRIHEWPPEGGVSTFCTAEPLDLHAAQMAKSEALLASIDWDGPAMVEYRYDPQTGRYVLMEINGRFWGSMPLAHVCGADFAWEAYRRRVLGDGSEMPLPGSNIRARYMLPETRRLLRVLFDRDAIVDPYFKARPLRDLAAYLLGFFDPRMRYFVFSLADPGPFFRDMQSGLIKIASLGKRLLKR